MDPVLPSRPEDVRFPDLAGYLTGAWAAERSIQDRRSGTSGRFRGTQLFSPLPAQSAEPGSHQIPAAVRTAASLLGSGAVILRAEEHGTLQMELPGQAPVESPVFRNHWWVLRGAEAQVFFEDGRPFHTLSLGDGAHSPAHWCSPDQYEGEFSLTSASTWEQTWEVRGPKKDLRLHTRLTRLDETGAQAPVIEVSAVALLVDLPDQQAGRPGQDGAVVLVRKRGTGAFMFPGGKPEPGETPLLAALRETQEELKLALQPEQMRFLGSVRTRAANEAATDLLAHLYCADLRKADLRKADPRTADPRTADFRTAAPEARGALPNVESQESLPLAPAAEIEEIALLPLSQLEAARESRREPGTGAPLAPLAVEHMLPRLLQRP